VKALLEYYNYVSVPVQNLLPIVVLSHFCDFSGLFCRWFLASVVTLFRQSEKAILLQYCIMRNFGLYKIHTYRGFRQQWCVSHVNFND